MQKKETEVTKTIEYIKNTKNTKKSKNNRNIQKFTKIPLAYKNNYFLFTLQTKILVLIKFAIKL